MMNPLLFFIQSIADAIKSGLLFSMIYFVAVDLKSFGNEIDYFFSKSNSNEMKKKQIESLVNSIYNLFIRSLILSKDQSRLMYLRI